jgi:hypothetical protein
VTPPSTPARESGREATYSLSRREGMFSETGLSTLRGFSEVSGELLWVALCFRWD